MAYWYGVRRHFGSQLSSIGGASLTPLCAAKAGAARCCNVLQGAARCCKVVYVPQRAVEGSAVGMNDSAQSHSGMRMYG